MRSTSGSTASARAMQRRWACPPDSDSARLELVLDLAPQRRTSERVLDDLVERRALAGSVDPRAVRDVVEDRLGERVRLLEHHADPSSYLGGVDLAAVEVLAVIGDRTLHLRAGREVVHPVERPQHGRLAATRRADERGDLVAADVEVDVGHRAGGAVEDLDAVELEHDLALALR